MLTFLHSKGKLLTITQDAIELQVDDHLTAIAQFDPEIVTWDEAHRRLLECLETGVLPQQDVKIEIKLADKV